MATEIRIIYPTLRDYIAGVGGLHVEPHQYEGALASVRRNNPSCVGVSMTVDVTSPSTSALLAALSEIADLPLRHIRDAPEDVRAIALAAIEATGGS